MMNNVSKNEAIATKINAKMPTFRSVLIITYHKDSKMDDAVDSKIMFPKVKRIFQDTETKAHHLRIKCKRQHSTLRQRFILTKPKGISNPYLFFPL